MQTRYGSVTVCVNDHHFASSTFIYSAHWIPCDYAGLTYDSKYVGVVDTDAGLLEATKAVDAIQVCLKQLIFCWSSIILLLSNTYKTQRLFLARGGVIIDNSKVLQIVPGAIVQVVTASDVYRAPKVVLVPGKLLSARESTFLFANNLQQRP